LFRKFACREEFGIGIAFLPEVSAKGQVVLSRGTYTQRFYAEDILGNDIDWSRYAEQSGGAETTFLLNMGEDEVFVQGGYGRNNKDVHYKVIVNCERTVDRLTLEHIESSLFVLDGERLHRINVAIPEIMSAGVELGPMAVAPTSPPLSHESGREQATLEGVLRVTRKFLYKYYIESLSTGQSCALRNSEDLEKVTPGSHIRVEGYLGTFHGGGTKDNPSVCPSAWVMYRDVEKVTILHEAKAEQLINPIAPPVQTTP
jgi:hypothetical protein